MKKVLLIFASILLMVLVACGNGDQDQQTDDQTSSSNEEQTTENETDEQADDMDEDVDEDIEKSEDESDEDAEKEDQESDQSDLEEYSVVEEHIDLDKYEMDIEEDNPHKRVILYKDDHNEKDYKSIYIKDKNRLKIIEFGHGEIYDEVID
ncbi:hypothetical protein KQI49_11795 [Virgibacillus sp. MSJ-26]|uniref:hypothetical protein n=1 Tax=Virgibacillus sp. MSJ-26 TaxID=2841522 RepID=UPI001C11B933|nr:hypothetical protein [Virgibacillus sp. MSJ-26]MBU5467502.1 hypothetical protein [Virgibacillus sp. MSJ-26]